ncbi:MAG: hypothetical protein AAB214_07055 [Fibrobacterota bacterium]
MCPSPPHNPPRTYPGSRWSRLESEVVQLGERVRYLKPEFLEGISEPATA